MGYVPVGFSHGCYATVPVYLFPVREANSRPLEDGDGGLSDVEMTREECGAAEHLTSDVLRYPHAIDLIP